MRRPIWRLSFLVVAAAFLPGCGNKGSEAPKEYAPPPKVGPGGALKGGEAPVVPSRPTK